MIEMPQLRFGQRSCKFLGPNCTALNGEPRGIWAGDYGQSGRLVANSKRGSPRPRLRICIWEMHGDGKRTVSAGEIWNGFEVNTLHKCFRCNEQLYRPIDPAIMRPITG